MNMGVFSSSSMQVAANSTATCFLLPQLPSERTAYGSKHSVQISGQHFLQNSLCSASHTEQLCSSAPWPNNRRQQNRRGGFASGKCWCTTRSPACFFQPPLSAGLECPSPTVASSTSMTPLQAIVSLLKWIQSWRSLGALWSMCRFRKVSVVFGTRVVSKYSGMVS